MFLGQGDKIPYAYEIIPDPMAWALMLMDMLRNKGPLIFKVSSHGDSMLLPLKKIGML